MVRLIACLRNKLLLLGLTVSVAIPLSIYAAVGCRLNNPDQDIKRVFPESSNYRTHFIRIDERGGENLYRELEKRLGDKWDPIWETPDIPYAYYEVLRGQERIGWVFGANQGWPGADNAQIIIATNKNGRIREMFFQKLPSLEKEKFQNRDFYKQFIGLTLQHFYIYEALKNIQNVQRFPNFFNPVSTIKDFSKKEHKGFQKILRGVKKLLVLFDEFWSESKVRKKQVFKKVQLLLSAKDFPNIKQPLNVVKMFYKEASWMVAEVLSPVDKGKSFINKFSKLLSSGSGKEDVSKTIVPVLLAYKVDNYTKEFVRGILLGYVMLLPFVSEGQKIILKVCIDKKGRIAGIISEGSEYEKVFERMKGLSLTNFYVRDAFRHFGFDGGRVDKIGMIIKSITKPYKRIEVERFLYEVKKALILHDEFYLNNFYKKEEIFKLVKKYIRKRR